MSNTHFVYKNAAQIAKANFFMVLALTVCSVGQAQDIINYFDVCCECKAPVTIKTDHGTYQIYGGEVIRGNLSIYSVVDARGNRVVNTTPSSTEIGTNKPTKRYYVFKSIYSNSGGKQHGGRDEVLVEPTFPHYTPPPPSDCFPNLQANVFWSFHMGEMITLQTDLGGAWGTYMQGGVGRNFFLKNPGKAISWMAEMGIYIDIDSHVPKLGMMVGRDQEHGGDIMLLFVGKYSYYLEEVPWLGFSGAFGAGFYVYDDGFKWDLRAGVTFRFLAPDLY